MNAGASSTAPGSRTTTAHHAVRTRCRDWEPLAGLPAMFCWPCVLAAVRSVLRVCMPRPLCWGRSSTGSNNSEAPADRNLLALCRCCLPLLRLRVVLAVYIRLAAIAAWSAVPVPNEAGVEEGAVSTYMRKISHISKHTKATEHGREPSERFPSAALGSHSMLSGRCSSAWCCDESAVIVYCRRRTKKALVIVVFFSEVIPRSVVDFYPLESGPYGKSVLARDRERQPSTNQITSLTRATPAIYQSYLPGRRNHPAYIAHRTRTRTVKTPSTLQLMRR